jgi:hypothetical protein
VADIVNASDRTYISDAKGTLRVLDYNANGVERSDLFVATPLLIPMTRKEREAENGNSTVQSVSPLSSEAQASLDDKLAEALASDTADAESVGL